MCRRHVSTYMSWKRSQRYVIFKWQGFVNQAQHHISTGLEDCYDLYDSKIPSWQRHQCAPIGEGQINIPKGHCSENFYTKKFLFQFFFILNSNFSDTQVYGSSSLGTVLFRRFIILKIFIPNSLFSNSRYPERSLFSVKVVNTVLSIIQAEKAEQIRVAEPVQSSLTCASCSAKTSKILTIQGGMPARYTGLDTD